MFTQSGGSWSQTTELTAADGQPNDSFGSSLALSADGATALIGADHRASSTGASYVFSGAGGSWSQSAELTASDGQANDYFGDSVALSADGSTILVGALGNNLAAGAAYVFEQTPKNELTASDGRFFGFSVALSAGGSTALIGAPGTDGGGGIFGFGAAYVFTFSNGSWSQTAELTASDGHYASFFGSAVALSADGTTALIGADGAGGGGLTNIGAAYVFTLSNGSWSQTTEVTDSARSNFGDSVALSANGTMALIGAEGSNSGTGAAYVFTQNGGTWSQTAQLTASNSLTFGWSVALTPDGTTALVGQPATTSPGFGNSPGAFYEFSGTGGTWSQTSEASAPDEQQGDAFGYAVTFSADGGTALVGAPGRGFTFKGEAPGAAYTYTFPTKQHTSTSLASSANPSVVGQPVSYTATLSPVPDGGTVDFQDGGTDIGGCGSVSVNTTTGQATCQVTYSTPNGHTITAIYSGDSHFAGSPSSPLAQTVNKAATTTALTSSVNPSLIWQQVTYTATIAVTSPGAGNPTGTVAFQDGGTTIAGCGSAPVSTTTETAICKINHSTVGSHAITATYSGDSNFTGGASAIQTQLIRYGVTLLYHAPKTGKVGHVLSLELELTGHGGMNQSKAGTVVNALCVALAGATSCAGAPISYGNGSPLTYVASLAPGGGYQFTVKTKGLAANTTYQLLFRAVGEDAGSYHVDAGATFTLTK